MTDPITIDVTGENQITLVFEAAIISDAPDDGGYYARHDEAWAALGSMALQGASAVAITGGAIDGATIGATTPASIKATTIAASGAITSTVATSNPPFVVASTTLVSNLYVAQAALADTVTTNANLTGPITSAGNVTSVAAQTGTGSTFVMQASPTLTTPAIGAATGASLSVTGSLTSTVAVGTPPLVVTSTTLVPNLYVQRAVLADSATLAGNALDGTFAIENTTDTTKQFNWSLAGMTTGKVLTLASVQTTSQTLTVPNITGADTIATLGVSNTFTKPTIVAPGAIAGVQTLVTITGPADTARTLSTEVFDFNVNMARTVTWATGAIATQRFAVFQAPTIAFVGASIVTQTATVEITGAPIAGANATLTSSYALWVNGPTLTTGLAIGNTTTAAASGGLYISRSANPFILFQLSGANDSQLRTITTGILGVTNATGSTTVFQVNTTGLVTTAFSTMAITPTATAGATPSPALTVTAASNTTVTSGTEVFFVEFANSSTVQWATSTPTTQRNVLFQVPTYSCDTTLQTITTAATVSIGGAPAAGTNVTITNAYALWVQAGLGAFTGGTTIPNGHSLGNAMIIGEQGTGVGNAQFWGLGIRQSGLGDLMTLAQSSTTYTTGGSLGWVLNNVSYLYTPSTFRWGTGTAALGYMECKGNGFTFAPAIQSSGSATGWQYIDAASTALTTATEVLSVNFNLSATKTWAAGNIATQRFAVFQGGTIAFASGSNTVTTAATVAITGAPAAGANAILTATYALWIQGGKSLFNGNVTFTGATTSLLIQQAAATSGTNIGIAFTGGAHTTLTSGTEVPEIKFDFAQTVQWATTTPATQRALLVTAPTYSCDSVSQTITTAATVAIAAAPTAGTNVTITNNYALWVQSGTSDFQGVNAHSTIIATGPNGIQITQGAAAGGTRQLLNMTPATNVSIVSGTEAPSVLYNAAVRQWATTTPATQREWLINSVTYACDSVSQTIANATGLYTSAPTAGTNVTITFAWALWANGAAYVSSTLSLGNALAAYVSTITNPVTFGTSGSGGSYPFNEAGNLIVQSRTSGAGRDIILATGTSAVAGLIVDRNQSVRIGVATIATNSTNGFPYIPAASGTPTGAPTALTGFVAMYYDTSAHKIWFYDTATSTWRGVAVT